MLTLIFAPSYSYIAAVHRAMARSALFSDSSARTRLKRYNQHMDKARTLEAREVRP